MMAMDTDPKPPQTIPIELATAGELGSQNCRWIIALKKEGPIPKPVAAKENWSSQGSCLSMAIGASIKAKTRGEVIKIDALGSGKYIFKKHPWKMHPTVKKHIKRLMAEAIPPKPTSFTTKGMNWLSAYCTPLELITTQEAIILNHLRSPEAVCVAIVLVFFVGQKIRQM